jgi:hypothetical protein
MSDITVIAEYERHGRLHDGTPHEMEAGIVDAWAEARLRGESVALMANTNHTVDRLNQLAQHHRITTGDLDPTGPALHLDAQRLLVGEPPRVWWRLGYPDSWCCRVVL